MFRIIPTYWGNDPVKSSRVNLYGDIYTSDMNFIENGPVAFYERKGHTWRWHVIFLNTGLYHPSKGFCKLEVEAENRIKAYLNQA